MVFPDNLMVYPSKISRAIPYSLLLAFYLILLHIIQDL
ncbi:hypothetical protein THALO_60071 [Tenacibaculum halocynthiae]|nr:hypothetical protein SAMN04487765_2571 [Tenacibaculum sp. MAR_2010_89]